MEIRKAKSMQVNASLSLLQSAVAVTPVSLGTPPNTTGAQTENTAPPKNPMTGSSINMLAANTLEGILQSQETLVNPSNDASGQTQAYSNEIGQVSQAYEAVAANNAQNIVATDVKQAQVTTPSQLSILA